MTKGVDELSRWIGDAQSRLGPIEYDDRVRVD